MLIFFILLILLSAFPLVLTIWRMRNAARIKKKGVTATAVVTHINTVRGKGGAIDILAMEYRDSLTNQPYKAKATVTHGQKKIGDTMTIFYLPDKPSKYAIDNKKAYWVILIFCVLLFLFIIFVVYKLGNSTNSSQFQ
jgi:hypothetical protein